MRGVLLEVPEDMLLERRLRGGDLRDEMWDGVLHMLPPPTEAHQELSGDLYFHLRQRADVTSLASYFDTGLFRAERDHRVPDLLLCRPDQTSHRGAEGAEGAELRSPDDDSYAKLPFYAALGVREGVVVHPGGRRVELFRLVDGALLPVSADGSGGLRCDVLGMQLLTRDGALHLLRDGGSAVV